MNHPILKKNKVLYGLCFIVFMFLATSSQASLLYDFEITIIDENSEPLIGVNVYTDDYSFAAVSDFDGKVVLTNLNNNTEVNFSYIGYQSIKLPFYEIRKRSGIVQMLPESTLIETVVVIGRRDDAPEDIPFTVENIGKKDIAFTNSQTAADALGQHGDIYVQKSQMGGGSPIIRGFEANKVLLVLDGVRMNNAIYRNGHLQNAITVDNSMLERVEVIYGPGSLMYGSDALGGVVHFRSKDPKLKLDIDPEGESYKVQTNAYIRYASANEEKTAHFDVNYGSKKWGSLTSFTFTDYNHLRAGSIRPDEYPNFGKRYHFAERIEEDQIFKNVIQQETDGGLTEKSNADVQIGTAYRQLDLNQKIRFRPNDNLDFIGNFQYSTTGDVPRFDQLSITKQDSSDLKWSEWFYGPQQRLLLALKTKYTKPNKFFNKATIITAFQRIDEERYKRKFARTRRTFNIEDVYVYSLTADFDKNMDQADRKVLSYGTEFNHNLVFSQAGTTNIRTGARGNNEPTRYPSGGSTMTTAAVYGNFRWKSIDSLLTLNIGLRYTYAKLHSLFSESDPIPWVEEYYTTGVGNTDSDLTWGIGATVKTPSKWQVRALASSAFRSPNIDDFSKVRVKNQYVTIPNPDLDSERALNAELTISKQIGELKYFGEEKKGKSLTVSATGFYTYLTDAIIRQNFALPNGQTTLFIDGEINETQANVNADRAIIYGFSGNILFNIADRWKFKSGINLVKGRQSFKRTIYNSVADIAVPIDTMLPSAHIPPTYGNTSLSYQHKRFKIEATIRYNAAKPIEEYSVTSASVDENGVFDFNRGGSSDNPEDATPEGTYAWTTYNLYTSWQLNEKFSINVALENITDIHYRLFSSGVSAPGRNLIVALRGSF